MQDQDLRTKDSFLLPCWTLHLPVLHLAALYNFKLKTSHMISGHILSWSKSALLKQQICVDVHQLKFWTIFQNKSTLKWPKLQPPNNPVQQMNVNLTSHCKMLISHFDWKYSHHRSDVLCLTFILWEEGAGERKQRAAKGLGLQSVSETARTTRLYVSAYLWFMLSHTISPTQLKVMSLSLATLESFTFMCNCFLSVHVFRGAGWLGNW